MKRFPYFTRGMCLIQTAYLEISIYDIDENYRYQASEVVGHMDPWKAEILPWLTLLNALFHDAAALKYIRVA